MRGVGMLGEIADLEKLEQLEQRERLRWAFRFRRRLIIGLVAVYTLAVVFGLVPPLLSVLAFYLLFFSINELREWRFHRGHIERTVTTATIVGEVFAVAIIIYGSGGYESFLIPLSAIQVVGISIHVGYELGWICAYLATTLFSIVNLLEYLGILPHSPLLLSAPGGGYVQFGQTLIGGAGPWAGFAYLVVACVAYGFLLSLAAYSSGYINSKLKVREEMLSRAHRFQSALYRVSARLLGELSIERATEILLEWLVDGLGYARSVAEVDDPRAGKRRVAHPAGSVPGDEIERLLAMRPPHGGAAYFAGFQYLPLLSAGGAPAETTAEEAAPVEPAPAPAPLGWILLACAREISPEEYMILETAVNHFRTFLEKARHHQDIVSLSIIDDMTGIHNHRHFVDTLRNEMKRSLRYQQPLSLLLMDVDHFKRVNDTHGHLVGDDILRGLAQRLKDSVRTIDVVARYGGEEFVVMAPQTDLRQAETFADRLRRSIADRTFQSDGKELVVSVSIGVSEALMDRASTEDDLIRVADGRLYRAKEGGRNRVVAS
jgi:diguanylate cyclase (GGDEF)-like protein